MNNVIPFHKCGRCGGPGSTRTLTLDGAPRVGFTGCDACVAQSLGTLDHVRPIFDAMIEAGIDRDVANETMTFLLTRAGL